MSASARSKVPAAIVLVRDNDGLRKLCGRTLLDRHLEILDRLGMRETAVVAAFGMEENVSNSLRLSGRNTSLWTGPGDWRQLKSHFHDGPVMLVEAGHLIDSRLYEAASLRQSPVAFMDGGYYGGEGERKGACIGLAVAEMPDESDDGVPLISFLDELLRRALLTETADIETLPTYHPELRKHVRPFWRPLRTSSDREKARSLLIRNSGKGHQDFPVVLFNRPVEEALMQFVSETDISPNQLTLATNVAAYIVTLLFAFGRLWEGALLAVLVGVLDGLDGRQARIQIRMSEFGRLEHLFDKLYEISWMGALGWMFVKNGEALALWGSAFWLLCYLLDTAAYDLFRAFRGMQIDEASGFDAAFRLIGGRRNVYIFMLIAGLVLGSPYQAFQLVILWSAVTAAVHWVRVSLLLSRPAVQPHGR